MGKVAIMPRPVERSCIICRTRRQKGDLSRFVMAEGSVPLEDVKRILPGRGYYVCAQGACRERWLRKAAKFQRRTGKGDRA
jgi:predicted RNA-binding protein YlxR (DUF448 family)